MSKSEQAPTTSWFYREGDRDVGPVMSGRLRQLARQGRLADDDLVRMGRTGQWVQASTIEWLSAKPRAKPKEPEVVEAPQQPQVNAAADFRKSLAYSLRNVYYSITHFSIASLWIVRHVLGVVALIAICVTLFNMGRDAGLFDFSSPVDVLGTVQTLGAEVKQKREAKAAEAEWDELKQRGTTALAPVVAQLEREAGSHNRIAQMLLWSARDCLPQMFDDSRTEPSAFETRYDEYMANVEALEKDQPIYGGNMGARQSGGFNRVATMLTTGPSWSTILIVAVMIVADLAIIIWLVRAWRNRRA
jgi:hypothetical protein